MIIDKNLVIADAEAITTSLASANSIDQSAAGAAYGGELFVESIVDTTCGGGTSLSVKVQHDSDPAFGTATDLVAGPVIATAGLVAGATLIRVKLPATAIKRYIRAFYTIVGVFTSGKVDVRLVDDVNLRIG